MIVAVDTGATIDAAPEDAPLVPGVGAGTVALPLLIWQEPPDVESTQ